MRPAAETRYSGQWLGNWESIVTPWLGPDFSRRCFLFVGQGSVRPGMFSDLYAAGGPLRERFDQADRWSQAMGLLPVSTFVVAPDSLQGEELVCQRNLALCTAEVGLFDAVVAAGLRPRLLTGFSLGEFPALCCAGVIEFVDMLRLVLERDRACDPANTRGYLLAVSAAPPAIAQILGRLPYHVSNLNSPLQTAIAVAPTDLDGVARRLRRANLRYRVLENVPQPYHCPWMQPAAERYRQWLTDNLPTFGPVVIPVLSSVTGAVLEPGHADPDLLLDILSRQLVAPVNFIAQISAARDQRCYSFMEIGPGSTLSGFTSEILVGREHRILYLADVLGTPGTVPEALTPAAPAVTDSPFARRLLDRVRQAIARATGYDIVSITVEDRFQEDLGIDSIKKADILFSVVKDEPDLEVNYDASAVRRIADVVAALSPGADKTIVRPRREKKANFQRFILDWQPQGLRPGMDTRKAPVRSRSISIEKMLVAPGAVLDSMAQLERIILRADGDVCSLASPDAETALARLADFLGGWRDAIVAGLATADENRDRRDLELCLVTDTRTPPMLLGLPAFFRSLGKEIPGLFARHLSFDQVPVDGVLEELIEAEFAGCDESWIRFSGGQRLRPMLAPVTEPAPAAVPHKDQIVVAIGGAGGILREILGRMASAANTRLVVVGRRGPAEVADSLAELKTSFREVEYYSLDATDAPAVQLLIKSVNERFGRIDLVLNAAGEERSTLLASKSDTEIRMELAAKVLPVANLFAALGKDIGTRVVSFSSIVAHWGNPGQTVYACANGVIEAITEARNRDSGQKLAVAVQWPPWNAVGMTASESVRSHLERAGVALLEPAPAVELLAYDLDRPADHVVHYGDESDSVFYRVGLGDHRSLRPVLGNPSTSGGYQRRFDPDIDLWLKDHSIDGTPVVPAATMMTLALCAANRADSTLRSLQNFIVHRPVQLRGASADLRVEVAGLKDGVQVCLRSQAIHADCLAAKAVKDMERSGLPSRTPRIIIKPSTIYHQAGLFHGPRFQVLHALDFLPDDLGATGNKRPNPELVVAEIESDRLAELDGVLPWDRLTLWVDGGFQALALLALRRYRVLALPVAVSRVQYDLESIETPRVRVIARETGRQPGRFRGEVSLVADNGSELVRLAGVELAEIRPAAGIPAVGNSVR